MQIFNLLKEKAKLKRENKEKISEIRQKQDGLLEMIQEYREREKQENTYFLTAHDLKDKINDNVEWLDFAKEEYPNWDNEGRIPLEFGLMLKSLLKSDEVNIGLHRTGSMGRIDNQNVYESDLLESVFTEGLKNYGNATDNGIVTENVHPFNTVSMVSNMIQASRLLKDSRKGSTGSILLTFPKGLVDEEGMIIKGEENQVYQTINGVKHIKPEFILGYVASDNGNLTYHSKSSFLEKSQGKSL